MEYSLPEFLREPWKPVARPVLIVWILFYALFLIHAFTNSSGFLILDYVNLPIHEAGHLLFGYLGETIGIWGGTLLQWLVPFLLAMYFFTQRHTTGFVFCLFAFFENWLNTATYMADARAMQLPLVTVGASGDEAEHDWNHIFGGLGLLPYDTRISAAVRFFGWVGMIGIVAWLIWRGTRKQAAAA